MDHAKIKLYTQYIELGMHLVPLPKGKKFPQIKDWGNHTICTQQNALRYIMECPDGGAGVALGASQMCSLDIDDLQAFATIMDNLGKSVQEFKRYPMIQGNPEKGFRILFRVPKDSNIKYQKLNWRTSSGKSYTVMELRTADDKQQRQDVLPPSIHPETGKPYRWIVPIEDDIPEPPKWLLEIWDKWHLFKPQLVGMDPNAVDTKPQNMKPSAPRRDDPNCVFTAWNQAHDLVSTLEQYGYRRVFKNRFLSPHSSTGLPGVILFDDQQSCWIHHASDPLCSEDTGKPVRAFDLYCHYEHQGKTAVAAKKAREVLGMGSVKSNVVSIKRAANSDVVSEVEQVLEQDGWIDYLHRDDQGKPIMTYENFKILLAHHNIKVTFDEIKKCRNVTGAGQYSADGMEAGVRGRIISYSVSSNLRHLKNHYADYMVMASEENTINPVKDWILSKTWDGKDRIKDLTLTLKPHNAPEAHMMLNKWLRAGAAAACQSDGIDFKGMLVLQGPQNVGKTSWVFELVGGKRSPLAKYVSEGVTLNPESKECIMECHQHWIVEAGELGSSTRRVNELKQFIGRKTDKYTRKYSNDVTESPRKFVLVGTVNEHEYLVDKTGSVRFLTIMVSGNIDINHGIDMQQVWAQAWYEYHEQNRGFHFDKVQVEEIQLVNAECQVIESAEELMLAFFDKDAPVKNEVYSASEMLVMLKLPVNNENRTAIKYAMERHFGRYMTHHVDGRKKKGVKMPQMLHSAIGGFR